MKARGNPDGWITQHVLPVDCRGWQLQDGSTIVRIRVGSAANPLLVVAATTLKEALVRLGRTVEAGEALTHDMIDVTLRSEERSG